jgi:hypothetical protein
MLIFDTLLWALGPEIHPRHISDLKALPISLIQFPSGQKLCVGNFSSDIYRSYPLHKLFFQISKLIFDTLLWAWGAENHPNT